MILPSGIVPSKGNHLQLQVSDDGLWLVVKVRVDMGLIDAYQCYHSYLTKNPYNIHPLALDYHGKVCCHKRIVNDMLNNISGTEIWDEHFIYLGRTCRRTLAGAGDGDTIFYGSTSVSPRRNGTRIFHAELIVEAKAKRLTKRPKLGTSMEFYEHADPNGDKVDVAEEEVDRQKDRTVGDDDDDDDNSSTGEYVAGTDKDSGDENDDTDGKKKNGKD